MMKDQMQVIAPYFVELLGRHDEVKTRYRFEQLPISIGSGYANDLILDDTSVANYHASIDINEAGNLRMRELGSQQGLVYQGKRVSALTVDANHVVKLGGTHLRIRSAGYIADNPTINNTGLAFDGIVPAIIGLLMLAISSLLSIWLASTDKFSMASYLFALAAVFALVMLWSGCWAFANRVISGNTRFGRHLFIVSCALVMIDVWKVISGLIAYTFSLEFMTAYANHATVLIVATMVFFHLTTISYQHPKRFIGIAAMLAIVGSGLVLLSNYQRSGSLADELYMSYLFPPELRQSQNQPADEFVQNAEQLKDKLDKARLEKTDSNASIFGQDFQ